MSLAPQARRTLRSAAALAVAFSLLLPVGTSASPVMPPRQGAATPGAGTHANAVTWVVDDKAKTITATMRLQLVSACDAAAVERATLQGPAAVARCNVTPEMVSAIKANIENAWNQNYKVLCYRLIVKVDVTVSEEKIGAKAAGAKATAGRLTIAIDQSGGLASSFVASDDQPPGATWRSTRPQDAAVPVNNHPRWPNTWKYPGNWENTYAHEAGHVLGLDDTYENFTDAAGRAHTRAIDGAPNDLMARPATDQIDLRTIKTMVQRAGIDPYSLKCDWTADRTVPGGAWTGTKCEGITGKWVLTTQIKVGGTDLHQIWTATIDGQTGVGTFVYDDEAITKVQGTTAWGWSHAEGSATVELQPDDSVKMHLIETQHDGWGRAVAAGQTFTTPRADQPLVNWDFPWETTECAQ